MVKDISKINPQLHLFNNTTEPFCKKITIYFSDNQDSEYQYGCPIYGFGQVVWLNSEYEEYYQSQILGKQIVRPREYQIIGITVVRCLKNNNLIDYPYWEYTLQAANYLETIVKQEWEIMLPFSETSIDYF